MQFHSCHIFVQVYSYPVSVICMGAVTLMKKKSKEMFFF